MYAQQELEVMPDYTRDELRILISRYGGRPLSVSQFYRWLPFALISRKKTYSQRDAKKLMFFAVQLNRVRDFELAKAALLQDLDINPSKYEELQNDTIDIEPND